MSADGGGQRENEEQSVADEEEKKNGENPRDGCAIMSISSRKGAVTNEPVATATCNSSYFTFTFDGIFLFS